MLTKVRTPVRQSVPGPTTAEEEDLFGLNELAGEAADKLGYTVLQNRLAIEKKKETAVEELVKLDAIPFTQDSVERYKKDKINRDAPIARRFLDKELCGGEGTLFLLLSIFALAAIMCCGGNMLISLVIRDPKGVEASAAATTASVLVFGLVFFLLWAFVDGNTYSRAYWKRALLCNYDQPIPEYVLATALAIRERFPDGRFLIEEFVAGTRDPFLIWQYEGKDYYIHVWNESRFKGIKIC